MVRTRVFPDGSQIIRYTIRNERLQQSKSTWWSTVFSRINKKTSVISMPMALDDHPHICWNGYFLESVPVQFDIWYSPTDITREDVIAFMHQYESSIILVEPTWLKLEQKAKQQQNAKLLLKAMLEYCVKCKNWAHAKSKLEYYLCFPFFINTPYSRFIKDIVSSVEDDGDKESLYGLSILDLDKNDSTRIDKDEMRLLLQFKARFLPRLCDCD